MEAIGGGATGLSEGDRVGYILPVGAYTSHRNVPADRVMHILYGVSDDVAPALFGLISGGVISVPVYKTMPLNDAAKAHRAL